MRLRRGYVVTFEGRRFETTADKRKRKRKVVDEIIGTLDFIKEEKV